MTTQQIISENECMNVNSPSLVPLVNELEEKRQNLKFLLRNVPMPNILEQVHLEWYPKSIQLIQENYPTKFASYYCGLSEMWISILDIGDIFSIVTPGPTFQKSQLALYERLYSLLYVSLPPDNEDDDDDPACPQIFSDLLYDEQCRQSTWDEDDVVVDGFQVQELSGDISYDIPPQPPVSYADWKKLVCIISTIPRPCTDAEKLSWLNTVVQKCSMKYCVRLEEIKDTRSLLFKISFLFFEVPLAEAFQTSKIKSRLMLANNLLILYPAVPLVQQLQAGIESAEVHALADPAPGTSRDDEKLVDSSAIAISSKQDHWTIRPTIMPLSTLQSYSKSVPNHEYPTMQSRLHKIGSFQLTTKDSDNYDPVFQFKIPSDLFKLDGSVAWTPFLNHVFNATSIRFRLVMNPSSNQIGKYLVTHVPLPGQPVTDTDIQALWLKPQLIYQRHGDLNVPSLDLGTQNQVDYVVPYEAPSSYIISETSEDSLSAVRDSALFAVVPVSALKTGDTNAQSLEVVVWASIEECNLNGLRYDVTPTTSLLAASAPIQNLEGGAMSVCKDIWGVVESIPVIGSIADTLGNVAGEFAVSINNAFGGPSTFEQNLTDIGMISGKGKDKGKGGGLLKTAAMPEVHITPRSNICLANSGQDHDMHKLGLHPAVQSISHGFDETISQLVQRPNLLKKITITTSTPIGTIIAKFSNGILNAKDLYEKNDRDSTGLSYFYGPLGHMAILFEYYVVKKEIIVQVVKSPLHQLTLAISGTPATTVPNEQDAGSQYIKIFDGQDIQSFSYDCPYIDKYGSRVSPCSQQTMKGVPGTPADTDRLYPTNVPFTGEHALILTNPLTVVSGNNAALVSSEVDILIWERALPGSQFFCPVEPKGTIFTPSSYNVPSVDDLVVTRKPDSLQELAGDCETDPKAPNTFGSLKSFQPQIQTCDVHDNIYALLNRFCNMFKLSFPTSYDMAITPRNFVSDDSQHWQWYLISCFAAWTGGSDLALIADHPTDPPIVLTYMPPRFIASGENKDYWPDENNSPSIWNGNFLDLWVPSVNPFHTITVQPYVKTPFMWIHANIQASNQKTYPDDNRFKSTGTISFASVVKTQSTSMTVMIRPSKDFRLHHFMGFLPITLEDRTISPVERHLVTDKGKSVFKSLKPSMLASQAGTTESYLVHSYRDKTPTNSAPLPQDVLITTSNPKIRHSGKTFTTEFSTLQAGGTRNDANLRLLASGIEANPGPVMSKFTDFKDNLSSKVSNFTKRATAPILDPLNNIQNDVHSMTENVGEAASSVNKLSSTATRAIESVESTVASLMETIKGVLGKIPDTQALFQALLHFIHVWINPTLGTIGISALGIFSAIGLIPTTLFTKGCEVFERLKSRWFGSPEVSPEPEDFQTLAGDPEMESGFIELASFAFSCIANLLGYKIKSGENYRGIFHGLANTIPAVWTTTTHISRFLKGTLGLFQRAFQYIIAKLPGSADTRFIVRNSEMISKFVDEATLMLNPLNREALKTQPSLRQRFWSTLMIGYYLQSVSAKNPNLKTPPALSTLINNTIKLADELSVFFTCCPVRYEPFVVHVVGDTKIGKSYMSNQLISEMLGEIGYRGYDNPIFVRTPGNKYWNGCVSQPCVMYDDFLAVSTPEFSDTQLMEMFSLKTPAIFNPPMAELQEKKLRYNPYLVWLSSNIAFPPLNGVAVPEAVYRRRDVLVHCQLKPEIKKAYGETADNVPKQIKENYGHLEFAFYPDPKDRNSKPTQWISYQDFQKELLVRHRQFHEREKVNVARRLKYLQALLPEQAARLPQGVDPFTLFYEAQIQTDESCPVQNGVLPSEMVEFAIRNNPRVVAETEAYLEAISNLHTGMTNHDTEIALGTFQNPEVSSLDLPSTSNSSSSQVIQAIKKVDTVLQTAIKRCNKESVGISNPEVDESAFSVPITPHILPESSNSQALQAGEEEVEIDYDNLSAAEQSQVDAQDRISAPPQTRVENPLTVNQRRLRIAIERSERTLARPQRGMSVLTSAFRLLNWIGTKTCKFTLDKVLPKFSHVIEPNLASHLMACSVCFERKPCSYRCDSQVFHPYCQDCYLSLLETTSETDPNCSVCRNNKIFPWTTSEAPTSSMLSIIASWIVCGQTMNQRFLDLLVQHAHWIEFVSLIGLILVPGVLAFTEQLDTMRSFQAEIDTMNTLLGSDYVLRCQTTPATTTYYAVSLSNFPTQRLNAGEEEEFEDCQEPDIDPTESLTHYYITTLEHQVLYKHNVKITKQHFPTNPHPCKCDHLEIQRDWDYNQIKGQTGYWVCPRTGKAIPDMKCQEYCVWTSNTRLRFLRTWATQHFHIVRDALKTYKTDRYMMMDIPMDFVPEQPLPQSTYTWVKDWTIYLITGEWWNLLSERVKGIGKLIGMATVVCGIIFGSASLFGLLSKSNVTTPLPQGYSAGKTVVGYKAPVPITTAVQALSGSTEFEHKMNMVKKNCGFIYVNIAAGVIYPVRVLFIVERYCLMTKHQFLYLRNWEIEEKQRRENPSHVHQKMYLQTMRKHLIETNAIELGDQKPRELAGYDLVCVKLSPTATAPFKDIIHLFQTKSENDNKRSDGLVVTYDRSTGGLDRTNVIITDYSATIQANDPSDQIVRSYPGIIAYVGFSGPQTCGSLLCKLDNNNPILGFHFSGIKQSNNSYGSAIPLCQESIKNLVRSVVTDIHELAVETDKVDAVIPELSGDYIMKGHVPSKCVPYQPVKSKIKHSIISDELSSRAPVHTEPACLSSRDHRWQHDISPLVSGCNKHCLPHRNFPWDIETVVVNAQLMKLLEQRPILMDPHKRSLNEAVCGILDIEQYPPIRMDTSPGWPYNLWKQGGKPITRSGILNPTRNEHLAMISVDPIPEFAQILDQRDKDRESGILQPVVYYDHLKDERRKPEKLRALGGTRVFSLSPLDQLLQSRQYWMDHTATWHRNWTELEHAVGISADGPDWTFLAQRLLSKSDKIICLDYSNFGPSLDSRLVERLDMNTLQWYSLYQKDKNSATRDNSVRAVMIEELCNSIHLCQDLVYQTYSGIPSGHPRTTEVNTEVNKAQIKICWLSLAPLQYRSLDQFTKHCCLFAYGDDFIMSVTDECISWFNAETIVNFFATFGVKLTSAKKDGTLSPWMSLEEATFLKRGFLAHPTRPGQWLAPLDWNSVTDCAHWVHEGNTDIEGTQVNAEQSLRLAYGHGPEKFNEWKDTLNETIRKFCHRGLVSLLLTWEELDANFFGE